MFWGVKVKGRCGEVIRLDTAELLYCDRGVHGSARSHYPVTDTLDNLATSLHHTLELPEAFLWALVGIVDALFQGESRPQLVKQTRLLKISPPVRIIA